MKSSKGYTGEESGEGQADSDKYAGEKIFSIEGWAKVKNLKPGPESIRQIADLKTSPM